MQVLFVALFALAGFAVAACGGSRVAPIRASDGPQSNHDSASGTLSQGDDGTLANGDSGMPAQVSGISRQEYILLDLRLSFADRGLQRGESTQSVAEHWIALAAEVARLRGFPDDELSIIAACSEVAGLQFESWTDCQRLPALAHRTLKAWFDGQQNEWAEGVLLCSLAVAEMEHALADAADRARERAPQHERLMEAALRLSTTKDWSFIVSIRREVDADLWPPEWEKMQEAALEACSPRSPT